MSIEIKEIGQAELKKFVKFPFDLYKGNPYWVPPLISEEMNSLTPEKNGAFEYCECIKFLAFKNGEIVGRIAGVINKRENERNEIAQAKFGWFDFIDDLEVSQALLQHVQDWAKAKGYNQLEGPLGFTNLDKMGMLIEGFQYLPTITSLYNFEYYPKHMEQLGYRKGVDWVEYKFNVPEVPEKVKKWSKIIKEKYNLKTLEIDNKEDAIRYGKKIFALFNQTHKELHGFSALNEAQVHNYIEKYIRFLRYEMITVIVDPEDEVVGFAVSFPSLAEAFQKAKGKLFPFGIFHIIRAVRKMEKTTLYLIGVKKEYQNKGVSAVIFDDYLTKYNQLKIKTSESNPELESNNSVQLLWKNYEYEMHKRRRSFIKDF